MHFQKPNSELIKILRESQNAMAGSHPEVAVIYLKNAEAMNPDNPTVRLDLGAALLATHNAGAAERELRASLHLGEPVSKVLPLLFQAMLDNQEARPLLAEYPAPSPSNHGAMAGLILRARAFAMAQLGNMVGAAASLDRALIIDRTAENLTARAQIASAVGDERLAMKLVDEALSKSADSTASLVLKVALLQKDNQGSEALKTANLLIRASAKSPLALITRAGVYLQLKQDNKALADALAARAKIPNLPQALYFEAIVKARAGDRNGAWALVQSLPPAFVHSQADIGIAVSQMAIDAGHREVGTNILSSIVIDFPHDVDARVRLALEYLRLKDTRDALGALFPLKSSSDPRVSVLLGQIYAKKKQYDLSLRYFEKASSTGFGGKLFKQQIATSNLKIGHVSAAISEFRPLNAKEPGNPQVAGPLIEAYLRKGERVAALKVAYALERASPTSPYGFFYAGEMLAEEGDLDGASAALSQAIVLAPKFVPALFDRALVEMGRGNLQVAQGVLLSAQKIDPKNPLVIIKEAEIAQLMGESNKAQALMTKVAQDNPRSALANLALVRFDVDNGKIKAASKALSAFLKVAPKDPSALAAEGNMALVEGNANDAISIFHTLSVAYPKSGQIASLLAFAFARSGDVKAAAMEFQHALALAPYSAKAHVNLIHYALITKNDGVALAAARSYAKEVPGPESARVLASTLVDLKKDKEARQILRDSLAKAPNDDNLIALSMLLRKAGQPKKADAILLESINTSPDDPTLRLNYADTQIKSHPKIAEVQMRKVLKLQPYNLIALNNLAWMLLDVNPSAALALAERAQKIAPLNSAVLDTLGWVKWKLNYRSDALVLLWKAHSADLQNTEASYHLAAVLDQTGHAAASKAILTALLSRKQTFDGQKRARALINKIDKK
jgi:putative PEP-CTERM system TPR-repeat lipoprotein